MPPASIPLVIDVYVEGMKKLKGKLIETKKLLENEDDYVKKIGVKEAINLFPKARRLKDSYILALSQRFFTL